MNILLSSCTHWWNAEAHYAAVLCEALRGAGHQAWILTRPGTRHAAELDKRGLPTITDVPVWDAGPFNWARRMRELRALQERLQLDVVNVFRSREFLAHVWAARGTGVAVVRTRGSAQAVRAHPVNRWLYGKACGGVIASAEVLRKGLIASLQLPPERVRTIYYPAEPEGALTDVADLIKDPLARRRERERLFGELGWAPSRKMLCIVGRIFPEKGHPVLLEALAALARLEPEVALAIADKGYEDEATNRVKLQAQISRLSLGGPVRLIGFRPDIRRIMACADLGVIPSLSSEMNCRVAMEFFSVGTPVVAFPTGALPEVVEEGRSGLVTTERTALALTGTLRLVLEDEDLRIRLSQGALSAARHRFSRKAFLEQTLAAYAAARQPAAQGRSPAVAARSSAAAGNDP